MSNNLDTNMYSEGMIMDTDVHNEYIFINNARRKNFVACIMNLVKLHSLYFLRNKSIFFTMYIYPFIITFILIESMDEYGYQNENTILKPNIKNYKTLDQNREIYISSDSENIGLLFNKYNYNNIKISKSEKELKEYVSLHKNRIGIHMTHYQKDNSLYHHSIKIYSSDNAKTNPNILFSIFRILNASDIHMYDGELENNDLVEDFESAMLIMIISLLFIAASNNIVCYLCDLFQTKYISLLHLNKCSTFEFCFSSILSMIFLTLPHCTIISIFLSFSSMYSKCNISLMFLMFLLHCMSYSVFITFCLVVYLRKVSLSKAYLSLYNMLIGIIAKFLIEGDSILDIIYICIFPQSIMIKCLANIVKINKLCGTFNFDDIYHGDKFSYANSIKHMLLSQCLYIILIYLYYNNFSFSLIIEKSKQSRKALYINKRDLCLVVKNLCKKYSDHFALNDVSFQAKINDIIAVIGPNGSGKSTLLNSLVGTLAYDSGKISLSNAWNNYEYIKLNLLGVCFQENIFANHLTVKENIHLIGVLFGLDISEINKIKEYYLNKLEMAHLEYVKSCNLSGGQKRKLCLILCLLKNPSIVVLDEPTANIDINSKNTVWELLLSLKDTIILLTSHVLEEAENYCNKIFLLNNGNIIFQGTNFELRAKNKTNYILKIVGSTTEIIKTSLLQFNSVTCDDENAFRFPVDNNARDIIAHIDKLKTQGQIVDFIIQTEPLEEILLNI